MEKYEILETDCYYHIYNRGNNKENLFLELENYSYFLKLIKTHLVEIAAIYAYCLLKNHFHLIIKIKSKEELPEKFHSENKLSQVFSNLFNAYTKAINKRYGREGSLFRVRFKRQRINDINYLRNAILYVHLNPVKHSFTNDYKRYFHSSFQSLISLKETLLKRKEVLELFGDKENFIFIHQEALKNGSFENFE